MRGVILLFLSFTCGSALAQTAIKSAPAQTDVAIHAAQTTYTRPVISFYEMRQAKLVRQSWDTSCGAAALSTLLTYHVGVPASEYAIATLILRTSDPNRVRQRGGFSLLDLKRFVESIGLVGDGFGSMTVDELAGNSSPAIVPIRMRQLDHFVIFRGRVGDRVLLGDPAFGNITITVNEFEQVWRSRIAFYVHAKEGASLPVAPGLQASELDLPIPNLSQVSRLLQAAAVTQPMRQLPLVARR